jgi:predicted DNA-binding protein YlxM (UPF0122 family)
MSYLSVKEYSEKYGVSSSSIYRKIRSGELQFESRGRRKFILDLTTQKEQRQEVVEVTKEPNVEVVIEEKDRFNSILESEVKMLRRKIEKLERYSTIVNSFFDDKFDYNPKEKIELESSVSRLGEYLLKMGFDRKNRKLIYNRFNNICGLEKRAIVEGNDYLLDFAKYNYDDLLKI